MASFFPLVREKIGSLSSIEEEGLQGLPNVGMSPVFTEDVGWIQTALDMGEAENLGGNGLTYPMVGKGVVAFGKLGVWNSAAGDHGLVVSKHVCLPF